MTKTQKNRAGPHRQKNVVSFRRGKGNQQAQSERRGQDRRSQRSRKKGQFSSAKTKRQKS